MSGFLEQEHDKLVEVAQSIIDYYWWEISNLSESTGDFSYLGVRLRKRKLGISIEWYNSQFTKKKLANGKREIIKDYIKKGKSNSYSLVSLKKHPKRRDYEIELIDELEPRFSELRKKSKALMKISLALKTYQKLPAFEDI